MKMFSVFHCNNMFTELSDFYINWTRRCDTDHNFVRSILIKAEQMDAKPRCAIDIKKREFAEKEEELILRDAENNAAVTLRGSEINPWDAQQQAKLMNDMELPNFIRFYNVRPKHSGHWDAYIYNYVREELCRISGIIQIYNCLTFVDKCLTVQEMTCGTLKELIEIQGTGDGKLRELVVAIIVLDLMKILRCIHSMNIIHGYFRSDNIFIANKITSRPPLDTLRNGTALLVKLANWDFAIRDTDGTKYCGYINDNKVVTNGEYECGSWSYEIDRMGFLNIVNELICGRTLEYTKTTSGRYIPLLKLEREWIMYKLWSHFFYKCLDLEQHTWDMLIDELAEATDAAVDENADQWTMAAAKYNVLFFELSKQNSQFYP